MTATVRLPAPTGRARNAARAKIAELRDTLSNDFASLFQIGKGLRHLVVLLFLAYYIRKELATRKGY